MWQSHKADVLAQSREKSVNEEQAEV